MSLNTGLLPRIGKIMLMMEFLVEIEKTLLKIIQKLKLVLFTNNKVL